MSEHTANQGTPLLPLVITPEELKAVQDNPRVLIIDNVMESFYKAGHIPGSVRLDPPSILYQHDNVDCDVPSDTQLTQTFAALGLKEDSHVVCYDRQGGPLAARVLWTLEELGHKHYSYLNGGLAAWKKAGYEVSTDDSAPVPSTYVAKKTGWATALKDYISDRLDHPHTLLLDARLEEEFTNELVICDRGGRIPGARHFNWEDAINVDDDSKLRPIPELQKRMDELGITKDKEIIVYCQTHMRSAHTYFVLKYLGYPKILGYPAGYSEWGNDEHTPIENEYAGED